MYINLTNAPFKLKECRSLRQLLYLDCVSMIDDQLLLLYYSYFVSEVI